MAKPTNSPTPVPVESRPSPKSRLPSQFLFCNLILRSARLSRLRFPRYLTDIVSHSFSSSFLESLSVIHLDLLSTNAVFELLLIFTIPEAEWVIVSITNRTWVNC